MREGVLDRMARTCEEADELIKEDDLQADEYVLDAMTKMQQAKDMIDTAELPIIELRAIALLGKYPPSDIKDHKVTKRERYDHMTWDEFMTLVKQQNATAVK